VKAQIMLLPGDGIGPEVLAEAVKVLDAVATKYGHEFAYEEGLIGGAAIDATGTALPEETLERCRQSDAVFLAAVGDPKYDDPRAPVRPEQGLLALRKGLGVFANLRPVKLYRQLLHASTIKAEVIEGVDLVVVRELTGGIYFGERGRKAVDGVQGAYDTMFYTVPEVERVVRLAFELARTRRKKVTSVDKANVLESSRLWHETADRVAAEYPDVEGSMGMLPSAALGAGPLGLYEPIHGSAPKYAGENVVNPIATILSGAMLLRHSLRLEAEAEAVEDAVASVLEAGYRTRDIMEESGKPVGTREMGDTVAERV
jgi:3-isopropylmalate dehydrogenase